MTTTLRPGSPKEAGMLPERVARARDLCARWVREGHTPTLGICVARRGVIVLHEAFGVLGPGVDSPALDLNAIFPVASVTKPVTATLVMQLVEDGLLGLNRPVLDYLPEVSGDGSEEMLVHHLLTHTTGYPWQTDPPLVLHVLQKLEAGLDLPPCPETQHPLIHQLLGISWDAPRVAAVGEAMIYSNLNYLLLGEIVRRLTGRGLEAVARERVFGPLGMDSSYYAVPESEFHRVVQRAPGLPFADPMGPLYKGLGSRDHLETPHADGGLVTTPLDMTVFGQMILNRGRYGDARVLAPATVAAMTRDQIPGLHARVAGMEAAHASWGYGFAVESPNKWRYFNGSLQPLGTLCHPGAGGAVFWIDRAHELVGTYFEVTTRMTERFEHLWNFDLFQNAITAAVAD